MSDPLMLGVSGLRGIMGTSLTPEVAARFAGAVGSWLVERHAPRRRTPRPMVVLGRDGRAGGLAIRHAAAAGLTAAGCDVRDLGVAMTPTVGVVTDLLGAAAGLVITASHNPQTWNGLKVLDAPPPGGSTRRAAAAAPDKATADALIARFRNEGPAWASWDRVGAEQDDPERALAFSHSAKVAGLLADLGVRSRIRAMKGRVVLDSVNASGRIISPALLRSLGVRLTHLGAEPTGLFPHTPEPVEANLGSVGRTVRKHKAAVGFCQDPDADRLALIDERGRFVGEEYTLVLAARALCELGAIRTGAALAVNLSTSRMIDDLAARHRLSVIRTPVGEANVVEAMKARRCPLGGEGNGGVIWPAVTYVRDSLGAMALVLALMAVTKKSLSQLVADIPAYAIVKRKIDLARQDDARPAIERIAAAYRSERVDLQDGVRVDFPSRSAWVHVRASNTEPIMRLIAEAPTRAAAEGLLDEVASMA